MTQSRALVSISVAVGALLFACEHNDGAGGPAASGPSSDEQLGRTNAQGVGADAAVVEQLSAARCYREQTCDNIGGGRKYASQDVCMNQMRGSIGNDLNNYNCPRGIDRAQLEHCMLAIGNEECSHPLDTITRMTKCRSDILCLR
jgi:hypothetical protein